MQMLDENEVDEVSGAVSAGTTGSIAMGVAIGYAGIVGGAAVSAIVAGAAAIPIGVAVGVAGIAAGIGYSLAAGTDGDGYE